MNNKYPQPMDNLSQNCGTSQTTRKYRSLSLKRKSVIVADHDSFIKIGNSEAPAKSPKRQACELTKNDSIIRDDVIGTLVPTVLKTLNNNVILNETKKQNTESELSNVIPNDLSNGKSPDPNVVDMAVDSLNCTSQDGITNEINISKESINYTDINCIEEEQSLDCVCISEKHTLISLSSISDIDETLINESLGFYEKPSYSVSIALNNCKDVNLSTKKVNIKRMRVSHKQNHTNIDCEVMENSQESEIDKTPSPPNTQDVSVNLQIKSKQLSTSEDYQSKVLILNTNAIEKLSHVIVQPTQYKSFRRKIQRKRENFSCNKRKSLDSSANNGKRSQHSGKLVQSRIEAYFKNAKGIAKRSASKENNENRVVQNDMSKAVRADTAKSDGIGRLSRRNPRREENESPRSSKMPFRETTCHTRQEVKTSNSGASQQPSPASKNESGSSFSPRRHVDSLHFPLPCKTKSNKSSAIPRDIPHYKIVAGTHFAVDAFCYGDIPGVKNYFLTHFHSDHYSGLKKGFNKILYCSKITADLCTSRLGVNSKCLRIINVDETIKVDGVQVTAIDANHCPGALMLLFTLPNGKTLLHTGDFRATPTMESHPAFWNNDIHTIYLDTTYCNPRYDFPTQDQSIDMALQVLRHKKKALEDVGKKFSSVLIICGTYTIGKEKFFLGVAKHVGCGVWACPEKDRVLQTVEGRSFGATPPHACQLHVVPMRDLTHEKLRVYLDSLQGAFSEVVAFKPSGWENGKNTPATKDNVTIHGIPYSEHSSFSEMIRFVKYLKPKQVVPTVDISGGVKAVQKYFPCPLVHKDAAQCQSKLTDFFNVQNNRQQISAAS